MENEQIFAAIESELSGLDHGIIRLEIHVRDGIPARYTLGRERSILPSAFESGLFFRTPLKSNGSNDLLKGSRI